MTSQPLWAQPHHDASALTGPAGPVALGDVVPVSLRVPHGGTGEPPVAAVHVRQLSDGEPVYDRATVDRIDDHDVWFRARLTVRNPMTRYRWLLVDGAGTGGATGGSTGPACTATTSPTPTTTC